MNTIAFSCARCGALLKVLKTFAGKTILCPRCAKKTPVPGDPQAAEPGAMSGEGSQERTSPGAAAKTVRPEESFVVTPPSTPPSAVHRTTTPPEAPSAPPSPAPASPVAAEEGIWKQRLERKEAEIRALSDRIRDLETQLETTRMRLERAERELAACQARNADELERRRAEWTAQAQAELEAARAVIARLEQELRERAAAPSGGVPSAAAIEQALVTRGGDFDWESEAARADVALSDLRKVSFSRFLRAAIAIHVAILGLTSVGYLFRRVRPPEARPEPNPPAAAETNRPAAGAAPSPAALPSPVPAPSSAPPVTSPSPASPSAPTPPKEWETLPAPGETPPPPTDIELKL
jgi:DNA-directed RNA polymerase subunit RPC12/RpoP